MSAPANTNMSAATNPNPNDGAYTNGASASAGRGGSSRAAKAPESGDGPAIGFRPQANMTVQPPRQEDLQKSYASIVGEDSNPKGFYGIMVNAFGTIIGTLGAIPCCICCPNPYKNVQQGNVGLVTKFGRFYKAVDPGLVKINPLSERLVQVDVKIQIVEVPKQVCMTKDNVTLNLTSVIYYHIVSPHKAAFGIANDVIERREEIAQSIGEIIEDVAADWGVQVESMLIKDIIFSQELQESLSMAAQSKRIGESKIIAAKAEVESAKLMRQAADILSSAPAMQIRYLEAMQAMAKTANSKVIFLPAANQTMPTPQQFAAANSSRVAGGDEDDSNNPFREFAASDNSGYQQALNARVIENI
ncbi:erythrocyte band 7 integral membrane protein [Magnaporthiopsis poae ATCC 64411]|uniref:Erythrocyte band 7 integral membrane protein n=1 Tax=Magnaporthiopsis poae (strain ATCC 64411 / 73-15) TaxID=644358 RepID=A0A0C4EBH7_MAGP6|nr:erythrocyte band 7 integral membrane protein [Magnaporthiopsis poae ATCC 64411]